MAKKILVVDDDVSIRLMVATLLRREGFEVEDVGSGNAALDSMNEKQYDAVVLDLMMRDGTGYDVLGRLSTQRPDVKCVVVISASTPVNIEKAGVANVEAKLRKPFEIRELLDAVRKCVDA